MNIIRIAIKKRARNGRDVFAQWRGGERGGEERDITAKDTKGHEGRVKIADWKFQTTTASAGSREQIVDSEGRGMPDDAESMTRFKNNYEGSFTTKHTKHTKMGKRKIRLGHGSVLCGLP